MIWGCDGVMEWQGWGNWVRKIWIMSFWCFVDAGGTYGLDVFPLRSGLTRCWARHPDN